MKNVYVCPVCEKEFNSLDEYAKHVQKHVEDERKAKEEAEKKKLAEQKEADKKKLVEAKNMATAMMNDYLEMSHEYEKKYNESPFFVYKTNNYDNIWDKLFDLVDGWN